jgi:deoxyadenosine/deoxycytidine kinase
MAEKTHMTYQKAFTLPPLVSIAGLIAAGKSTLVQKLADALGWLPVYETTEQNPYLPLFSKDHKTYAMLMESFLLTRRFLLHVKAVSSLEPAVLDNSILQDAVFALMHYNVGNITELDFRAYRDQFSAFILNTRRPDIIIYLDVTPEIAADRSRRRNREDDHSIDVGYLRQLHEAYMGWLEAMSKWGVTVIRVDWSSEDIDSRVSEIVKLLERHYGVPAGGLRKEHGDLVSPVGGLASPDFNDGCDH